MVVHCLANINFSQILSQIMCGPELEKERHEVVYPSKGARSYSAVPLFLSLVWSPCLESNTILHYVINIMPSLSENIQLLGWRAKVRLCSMPKRKNTFCSVELPVLCVLAKAICKLPHNFYLRPSRRRSRSRRFSSF